MTYRQGSRAPPVAAHVDHVDIIDGKLWILHDGTERGIADELVAAGLPRDHIVLGFRPAYARRHTDFAVA